MSGADWLQVVWFILWAAVAVIGLFIVFAIIWFAVVMRFIRDEERNQKRGRW